jgi:hypothetical protein
MSFFKKYYSHTILAIIFFLGLAIRLYNLNLNIPELYADETGGSYLAFQEAQNSLLSVSHLASFTWLLGLNPLGVRLSSALYGSLLSLFIYLFSYQISKSKSTALLTSFLTAILPWGYLISRMALPYVLLMVILVLLHLYLYLKSQDLKSYLVSLIPLLLATYCYPSIIVIFPFILLMMFTQIFNNLKTNTQKLQLLGISVLALFLLTLVFVGKYKGFSNLSRGVDLSIWNDVNVTATHNLYRGIAGESLATKLVYNKPLSIGKSFILNYASFFSPDWLFFKGDPVLRHSTGMVGSLFPILAPFLLFGAFKFFSSSKITHKTKTLFLVWIAISPIPAALTSDGAGYLLRVITMMPFLTFLSVFGIVSFYSLLKNKYLKLIYITLVTFSLIFSIYTFLYGYFIVYPKLSSTAQSFEYGFKDLSDFQVENNNAPMLIIWQGDYPKNHFYFWQKVPFGTSLNNLFFLWPATKADLDKFLSENKIDYLVYPGSYLTKNPEYLPLTDPVKVIKYPDGKTAFSIYKIEDR